MVLAHEPDKARTRPWPRGLAFLDFDVGRSFQHHWGRTITEADTVLFSTATLAHNPLYFDRRHARALGHADLVVNPYLVLAVVIGLSVEDLSERSEAFLGLEDVAFRRAVAIGETLTARSVVVARRESGSRPGTGIVTWRTEGVSDDRDVVVAFRRSNLFRLEVPDACAG